MANEDSKKASASLTPPEEGKTTIDDKLFFEPARLSYQCADAIARKIATDTAERVKDKTVIVVGTALLADFANLTALKLMLEDLQQEYSNIAHRANLVANRLPTPQAELRVPEGMGPGVSKEGLVAGGALAAAAAALTGVTPVIGAALGLVGLLKQDVEYHGLQTPIDSLSFAIALAAHLKDAGAKAAFVPELLVLRGGRVGTNSLRQGLQSLQDAKSEAWEAVGPLIAELVGLERDLDTASTAKEKDADLIKNLSRQIAEIRRRLDPISLPLERADQRLAELQTQWAEVAKDTGLSLMARLLRTEAIRDLDGIHLHAAVVCSGGHHRISHSLMRTITLGDGLSFAAGAVARWALLSRHGEVEAGGILNARETSGLLFGRNEKTVYGKSR